VFLSLTLVTLGGFLGGALFWVMFDKALDATSTDAFCVSCHSMRSTVYQEFQGTPHASNALGVRATCADCHVPHAFTPKMVRKVQAIGELWAEMTGKVDTPEKFERHRWAMAEREWARLTANRSAECRTCHDPAAMDLARQPPAAAAMHRMRLLTEQATCIDCHKGIAHQRPKPPNG
jgi:cytochrome c-type protein NapC